MSNDSFTFDTLPLGEIDPGTTLLVSSRSAGAARDFGLQMCAEIQSQAVIVVTTTTRASDIVRACRSAGLSVNRDRTVIIDCTGKRAWFSSARVERVSSPANAGGIGFQFSQVSQEYVVGGVKPVGVGIFSLSEIVTAADLKTVSRFVNTATGRIQRVAGLGVLGVDPSAQDQRAIDTIAEFCDGRIEIRQRDGEAQLRVPDLPHQPSSWTSYHSASQ